MWYILWVNGQYIVEFIDTPALVALEAGKDIVGYFRSRVRAEYVKGILSREVELQIERHYEYMEAQR